MPLIRSMVFIREFSPSNAKNSHCRGIIIECDATIALIENKDITISQLMKHIPGPDFPTGGIIIGKDILKQGYNKGRGSFKIRGEIDLEEKNAQID